MKIERISDNQIRCTLNHVDLQERQISLKELAYGSPKARSLFREMIQKAMMELGFDTTNMPLMIEAIPLSGDGIMLVITKIEDPEELDTRFARFAPALEENVETARNASEPLFDTAGAEDILHALGSILQDHKEKAATESSEGGAETSEREAEASTDVSRCFWFRCLDDVMQAAEVLAPAYQGRNSLYQAVGESSYYLAAYKSSHTPEDFNRFCNILTEYSEKVRTENSSELYYKEHYDCIIADRALQSLGLS